MVTVFLRGGVSLSILVGQAQLDHSCCQRAFKEPYNGNHQHLHFIPHYIQNVECNVLHNGHRLLEIGQSVLKSFSQTQKPSRWWLHTFLLLQSCSMYCVPHATACIQGTYVICSSKGIQWCWGMYLLRGDIKRLVVEWTGMLVEFCDSYDDFDRFHSCHGRLERPSSAYLAGRTRHIIYTIRATRRNGQYLLLSEISTRQLDQSLRILQVSLLPFFPILRNITLNDMYKQLPWRNNKSTIERF